MQATPFSLVERILQKVVAMILDGKCLLVLLTLQRETQPQSEKSVSEKLNMPLKVVKVCLQNLVDINIIKRNNQLFEISYKDAIEYIVYRYKTLSNLAIEEKRKRENEMEMYECVGCKTEMNFIQTMEYFDYETGIAECPNCGCKLARKGKKEQSNKYSGILKILKPLEEDLLQLKKEYCDVSLYPIYYHVETTSNKEIKSGKGKRTDKKNSSYLIPRRVIVDESPMPWELDDKEEENIIENDMPMSSLDDDSIETLFSNDEKQPRSLFLKRNDAFKVVGEDIVPRTPLEQTPIENRIIITRPKQKQQPRKMLVVQI